MNNQRLESFSDGVLSIICTLLVFALQGPDLSNIQNFHQFFLAMTPLIPKLLSFALSFITIIAFWVNHTVLFTKIKQFKWSTFIVNSILLLMLSMLPFSTGILGEAFHSKFAIMLYAFNLLLASIVFAFLAKSNVHVRPRKNRKEFFKILLDLNYLWLVLLYGLVIFLAFMNFTTISIDFLFIITLYYLFSPDFRLNLKTTLRVKKRNAPQKKKSDS